ncbi:aromatic-ring-hydroxylating dioxygenase subunit beta [Blastomonas sp. AAP53]|uniref:aromatic-ring-hydroxylating dioxygenase subunit beta n=1 Tax=Blastomonas sp. AAP53 TaxID=1248760 RepID=UPI00035D66D6|nr:aromatic-ring-hydroxylating dioxygenase subunit beta [Blastomonas sp. AAP53]
MSSQTLTAAPGAVIAPSSAERLIIEEAACLDEQRWDDWLALFVDDARFWVPSWDDYSTPTTDPESQLSLIFYASRKRLEERVWRLRSGQSPASVPLHRTVHSITNIRVDMQAPHVIHSNVVVHSFNPRRKETTVLFGTYRHSLVAGPDGPMIAEKKILIMNDYLPASVDIYTI